jgi:hypothetical protein
MSQSETGEYFVYLYRDQAGNPLYVGRERVSARSLSHTGDRAHNEGLSEALASAKTYAIENAGPFGTQDIAALVEAALISALANTPSVQKHLNNKIHGIAAGIFRPLGVPPDLATRPLLPPMTVDDLKKISEGKPVLLVYVGSKTLGHREGVDLARIPSDVVIQERMVRWWQLNSRMSAWRASPQQVPAILLGVSGTAKHRVVIGSLQIDNVVKNLPWKEQRGGLSEVPVRSHSTLDSANIRGRRLEPSLVKFGHIRSMFFKIV